MAALTKDRNTIAKDLGRTVSLRMDATQKIFKGSQVRLNAAGFAIPGDDAAGGSDIIGVADETLDNTGAAGALRIRVSKGTFIFANNGNVVQATTGINVTCVDDQTVGLVGDTTNDHVVGVVDDFSDGGVVVHIS